MRMRTTWGSVTLIPETDADIEILNALPTEAESSYEGGGAYWVSEVKEFQGANNPNFVVELPMGKAFSISR